MLTAASSTRPVAISCHWTGRPGRAGRGGLPDRSAEGPAERRRRRLPRVEGDGVAGDERREVAVRVGRRGLEDRDRVPRQRRHVGGPRGDDEVRAGEGGSLRRDRERRGREGFGHDEDGERDEVAEGEVQVLGRERGRPGARRRGSDPRPDPRRRRPSCRLRPAPRRSPGPTPRPRRAPRGPGRRHRSPGTTRVARPASRRSAT